VIPREGVESLASIIFILGDITRSDPVIPREGVESMVRELVSAKVLRIGDPERGS